MSEKKKEPEKIDADAELKQLNAELQKSIDYGVQSFGNMKLYKIVGDELPFEQVSKRIKEIDTQISEAIDTFLDLRLFIREAKGIKE